MPDPDVIVVNLGTTREPTAAAVRVFLDEFLGDPQVVDWPRWLWLPVLRGIILRRRPARVAEQYATIWTAAGSPLALGTEAIRAGLAAALGASAEVSLAYRYGPPNLADVLRARRRVSAGPITVVPLFPQPTGSTTGTIERLVDEVVAASAGGEVRVAIPADDGPHYVAALADRCRTTFAAAGPPEHLVVSFHGIPERYDRNEGGRYRTSCERTHAALIAALGWDPAAASLCFQSRFGPERWLRPATDRRLVELARTGVRRVAVTCPGFLTEGLETVEEIGVRGRASFVAAGGEELLLVPAVVDHPEMIRSLTGAIAGAAAEAVAP